MYHLLALDVTSEAKRIANRFKELSLARISHRSSEGCRTRVLDHCLHTEPAGVTASSVGGPSPMLNVFPEQLLICFGIERGTLHDTVQAVPSTS